MKLNRIIMLAALAALSAGQDAEARTTESLSRDWLFVRGDSAVYASPDFTPQGWETVNLPHDFLISQPWVPPGADEKADLNNSMANIKSRLSSRGFKEPGVAWYRREFAPPAEWKGRRVLLDFGGIMLVGDVWFNGQKVGKTDYGYLGFEADITPLINWDGPNVIAVRADTGKPENSRWYTGGGLYRDVKAVATDPDLYFTRHPLHITTPVVSEEKATVRIGAEIANRHKDMKQIPVRLTVTDQKGDTVYTAERGLAFSRRQRVNEYLVDSITLASPALWDTETPNLYTATLTLLDKDGRPTDTVEETFGIRSLEYSPEFGLKLNGKKTLLKGMANHHTLGALGAAAYPAALEKRIKLLKEFGFNHIRTSHNPYSEEFMDLCDKYGILVVDELYDKWTQNFAGGRIDWMQLWPHDVPEWVKRDRNHPSVVMWSLGNELQMLWELPYADWGVTPYRLQKTLLNRYDTTRPVTVAMHPRYRSVETDSIPAPLALATDVASYNYRYMYFAGDARRYPHLMFYQSEANHSGMGPNWYGMDLDKVLGLAYWGMIDYLGESAGWPAKGWAQGVFDISLRPKPDAYFLRSFFKPDEPVVHIGVVDSDKSLMWNDVQVGTKTLSDHWNRKPGSHVDLYTYTNADEVELLLNGKSLGRRANDTADINKRNRIFWDSIPYAPGTLEARAYRKGEAKPVATHRIKTAGEASRLKVTPDATTWKADGTDLMHLTVEAVDKKGTIDPSASQLVTFEVEGPAEIAGVMNGNITSDELSTGNTRSLYQGAAQLILRSMPEAGPVTLTVSAPGLKTQKVMLKTE
ncbi:MAG: DUF4982 domain-containing protein [Duncaniella sp.]|nr:DUF4982 domain-containing protein [Duncaniella sp.]